MKLWGGRFSKEVASLVDNFNESISVDACMYEEDILGSKAHAKMLGNCGLFPEKMRRRSLMGWSKSVWIWKMAKLPSQRKMKTST